ncbi:hypothetical protein [Streptomyces sp. NBC_00525]|uniref:hypothetical protein n=1 Tax=Streptomyces sp. NBC_00525 TaxID=2903660 RepID=UPI002E81A4B6|nr:hypothetical protein [Streptomyces sp. NBC_00525]WUC96601.1 hypothetical protein OG710_24645 [Streptomyces sp. NBC_00525]
MIDLGKIPTFTGNLATLETHAAALKTTAGAIRTTGKDVHEAFQTLDPVYDAPEQEELLDSTIPVRDKADAFADKLETVSGALSGFATAARPLVARMNRLREDAAKFVAENKDDDDWQQDQDKIDENERLVHEVGTTWVAFQGAERDAANKITALVGGTRFVVDDGSHKAGMYGFRADDVKDASETPWGTVDEREYTGLRAAWEWTKDNVGGALKGFFVDGVWGTIKGLGSMVNVFDWDNFKKTWSGIGDVFGGVSAYLMTPYDWAMDQMFGPTDHSDSDRQKAALRNFGKSLVAWDEWGTDPSRAFGTVLFNVVTLGSGTLLKLGRAGKVGAVADAAAVAGKAGVLVDPMTWLGKAAGVTKIKAGDLLESLKAGSASVDDMARTTDNGVRYVDEQGNPRVIGDDAIIRDEHGNPVPDTEPVREPHKNELPAEEKILEGAGGPSHAENSTNPPPHAPSGGAGGSDAHTPGGGGGGHGDGNGGSGNDGPTEGPHGGGDRPNEPLPAFTTEERAAHWDHLDEVEQRAPDEFDHLKYDPDHMGRVSKSSMDEARVGLDLREQGRLPADIQRPPGADMGEFYSASTGKYYDIKGIHSFWPPFNTMRNPDLLTKPFPGAYNPAKHAGIWIKNLTHQIKVHNRIVIIDVRNANQIAIDSIKGIIKDHGWEDNVIWYP